MIGWPYFSWSSGYTKPNREALVKRIYETNSKEELCALLRENRIDYIITEKQPEKDPAIKINHQFLNSNFKPVFFDAGSSLKERIFATKGMCENAN
jgi:hypothetical protein